MSEVKHTPTPWVAEDGEIYDVNGNCIGSTIYSDLHLEEDDKPNAAHIVKCVNLHDELVRQNEIMKEALDVVADYDTGSTAGLAFTAKEALKKAGVL